VRWVRLFDDLEGQLEAAEVAELQAEVADRSRREAARLRLVDRLRAHAGAELSVDLPGAGTLHGRLARVGPDWLLLAVPTGAEVLVPLGALLGARGLTGRAAFPESEGVVASRLDLRYALRLLARDRVAVTIALSDGSSVAGTIDRVGMDFLDLAEHPVAEPRRQGAVWAIRAIPLGALVAVRGG